MKLIFRNLAIAFIKLRDTCLTFLVFNHLCMYCIILVYIDLPKIWNASAKPIVLTFPYAFKSTKQ